MKKILLFAFAAIVLATCNNPVEPDTKKLSVDPAVITCPDMGGDYEIALTANAAWSVTSDASWVSVSPQSGDGNAVISVRIAVNKENTESYAKLVFTSAGETAELSITRAPKAAPALEVVSDKEIFTPKNGGEYTIKVESNIRWSISSNASWAKVSKGVSQNNDNITVTVAEATTPNETTATLTIAPYGEGKEAGEQTVIIKRGGTDATSLIIKALTMSMPPSGGNADIGVESNCKWRATADWDMDWLTITNAEGEGNGSFSIQVEPATSTNKVSGVITVTEVRSDNYTPVMAQMSITRRGLAEATLSVEPLTLNAKAEGGNFAVKIQCNYSWTASSNANRIASPSTTKGDKNGTLIIKVKPATDDKEAFAKITITTDFGNEKAVINVRRAGKEDSGTPLAETPYFSVAKDKKVYFAKGNLQYNAKNKEWRFASNQYDIIGKNNEKIDQSYNGWIDLFGYGTSGKKFMPYNCSSNYNNDYATSAIAGSDDDWGVYLTKNDLLPTDATTSGVEGSGKWRTLTSDEWAYLLHTRSEKLIGFASINNYDGNGNKINGFIILPDNFKPSTDLGFVSCELAKGAVTWRIGKCESNAMSRSIWNIYEQAGAVFMPFAGYRVEQQWRSDKNYYWASDRGDIDATEAKGVFLAEYKDDYSYVNYYYIIPGQLTARAWGAAVRLAQDAE